MLTNWTNNAVVFTTLSLLVRGTCSAYSISRAYVYYDRIRCSFQRSLSYQSFEICESSIFYLALSRVEFYV